MAHENIRHLLPGGGMLGAFEEIHVGCAVFLIMKKPASRIFASYCFNIRSQQFVRARKTSKNGYSWERNFRNVHELVVDHQRDSFEVHLAIQLQNHYEASSHRKAE